MRFHSLDSNDNLPNYRNFSLRITPCVRIFYEHAALPSQTSAA